MLPATRLEATFGASLTYVDTQVAAAAALDTKLVGLLALYGTGIAPAVGVLTSALSLTHGLRAALFTLAACAPPGDQRLDRAVRGRAGRRLGGRRNRRRGTFVSPPLPADTMRVWLR
jgi:hypothetical protein